MVLPRDEIDRLLAPTEFLVEDGIQKKDSKQVASAYTEDAAVIHRGHSIVRTRAGIAAAYEEYFKVDISQVKLEKTAGYDVNDGEYLMRKGRYTSPEDGAWHDYMVLFQRQPDGGYLIIHDEY